MPVQFTTQLPDAQQPTLDASTEDELSATWDDVTDNGDYRVQIRDVGETTWDGAALGFDEAVVASDNDKSGTGSHTFTSREDGEQYEVRLRSETEHVTGNWTTLVSATTVFPAPTDLKVISIGAGQIRLDWTRNDDNPDGTWDVYRSQTNGDIGSVIGTINDVTTTTFTDDTVTAGTTYYYTVRRIGPHETADTQQISKTALDLQLVAINSSSQQSVDESLSSDTPTVESVVSSSITSSPSIVIRRSLTDMSVSTLDASVDITDRPGFSYPTFDTLEVYGERGLNDEPIISQVDTSTLLVESLGLTSDDPGPETIEALVRQAIDDALSSDDPTIQTGVVSPIDALAGVDIAEAVTMVDTASAQTSTLSVGALTQAGDVPIAAEATASPLTGDATTHSTDTGFVDLVATPRTTGSTGIADDSGMVTLLVVPLASTETGIADTVGLVPLVASPQTSDEFSSIVESPDPEPIVASMLGDTTGVSTDGATLSPFVADPLVAPGDIVLPRSLAQATVTPEDATISIAESDALEQLIASPLTSDDVSSVGEDEQYVSLTVQSIVDTNSTIALTTDPIALTASPTTPQSTTLSSDQAVVQPIVASLFSDETGIADDTPNIVEVLAASRRGLIARNEAGTVTFISSDTLVLDEQQVIRGGLVRDALTPIQITLFADSARTVDAGVAPRKVSIDGRNRVELTSENLLVEKMAEEANDVERLDI